MSGLGGALGGAAISSILQYIFLKRNTRRREHLEDIKKEIVSPLLDSISRTSKLEFLVNEPPELYIYSEGIVHELKSILE